MMPIKRETFDHHRMEFKFYISLAEAAALRARLAPLLDKDPHSDAMGRYHITSIYFDTLDERSFHGSNAGVEKRKKIRIRAYNHDPSFIKLEYKEKNGKLSRKRSMTITKEECDAILAGDPTCLLAHVTEGNTTPTGKEALALQLYHDLHIEGYRPTTVVEYTREIYTHPISRVRITLDTDVRSCAATGTLFPDQPMVSILPVEKVLLEVKYSHFLPDFIATLLPRDCTTAIANSKFLRARAIQ